MSIWNILYFSFLPKNMLLTLLCFSVWFLELLCLFCPFYSKFKFLLKNTLVKRINADTYFTLAKTKQSWIWIIPCFDQPSSPAGPYPNPAGPYPNPTGPYPNHAGPYPSPVGHTVSDSNPAEPYLNPFFLTLWGKSNLNLT